MENATKALLIAAAVLVAILIISLGVGVFTSASEQMGDADLTEYQKQEFNAKFTKYSGTITGAELNTLLKTVFNHNNSQPSDSTCVPVYYTDYSGARTLIVEAKTGLDSLDANYPVVKKYEAAFWYEKGLVDEISVWPKE